MTAFDTVFYVLGAWVGALLLVLGAEKARQEWLARRASRPAMAPGRPLIPAQRTGGEPR